MTPLRVRYQTIEFGHTDIHLRTLRDNQQYADEDGIALRLGISPATWPLFGIVWASGTVLAHLMAEHGFTLQCEGSVLYGLCRSCAQNSPHPGQTAQKCEHCVDTDKEP